MAFAAAVWVEQLAKRYFLATAGQGQQFLEINICERLVRLDVVESTVCQLGYIDAIERIAAIRAAAILAARLPLLDARTAPVAASHFAATARLEKNAF